MLYLQNADIRRVVENAHTEKRQSLAPEQKEKHEQCEQRESVPQTGEDEGDGGGEIGDGDG